MTPDEYIKNLDGVYRERNLLVMLLASICDRCGEAVWYEKDVDNEGWIILYMYPSMESDIQLSWHMMEDEFIDVFMSKGRLLKRISMSPAVYKDVVPEWDGHTTEDKYKDIEYYIRNGRWGNG